MASDTGVSLPEEEATEEVEVPQETLSAEVPEEQETPVTETEEISTETEWEWPEYMGENPDVAEYTTLEELCANLEGEDYIIFRGKPKEHRRNDDVVAPSEIRVLEVYHGDVQVGDIVEWQIIESYVRVYEDVRYITLVEGTCDFVNNREQFLIAKVLERDGNWLVCDTAVNRYSFTELSKAVYRDLKIAESKGINPPLYQFRLHILETYAPEVCVLETE